MTHPGPLLADWVGAYGLHPRRNDLTLDECDLLTGQLLTDPTSRVYNAAHGLSVDLRTYSLMSLAATVSAFAGGEFKLPYIDEPDDGTDVTDDELERARNILAGVSRIADLPE